MSFLAPLFLIGAAAVAAPILFHLIRRTARDRQPFSSLMFLQPTPPRVTRSSRLEHILLLILRCIALALLALGFARPFFQKPMAADNSAGEGRRLAVVLDASASMRRQNLWAEARARAEQAIKQAGPADAVAVFLLDRTARPLVSFEQWSATAVGERVNLALQRVREAEPGWGGTHLGHGLLGVVDALEESAGRGQRTVVPGPRRLVLITDLQEGAHLDGLQGFDWPKGLEVVLEPVKARRPTNAGLQLVIENEEALKPAGDEEIKVRVINAADSKREQFQVGWVRPGEKTFLGTPVDAYVPPGQNRVLAAPKPPGGVATEELRLAGDDEDFDNRLFLVTPKPEQIQVLYLGNDGERDPAQSLYYLRRAFPETRRQKVQIVARPPAGPIAPNDLYAAPLLIVADALAGEGLKAVQAFLAQGKPVLFVLRTPEAAPGLAALAGVGEIQAEEVTEGYALLGQVDFEHPLFAPFADPRFSDFTKIHYWKHRRVNPEQFKGAKVLARFDKGDPALLQVPAGKGLVFVLTSGWHPADSQLALSSKFVPWLSSLLDLSGGVKAQLAQYTVGDVVTLPATNSAQAFTVRKPDGSEVKLTAGGRFAGTDLPGLYTIVSASSTQRFAVNLEWAESRTAPLPIEELERLRLPLKVNTPELVRKEAQRRVRLHEAELEQRQKIWRWLLVSALVVLVIETAFAGWLTRRRLEAEPA